jgi:hypothetical protein
LKTKSTDNNVSTDIIHAFFATYNSSKNLQKEKEKLKRVINSFKDDMFVKDSVVKNKKKELEEVNGKLKNFVTGSNLKMIHQMLAPDWTGNSQDRTAYTFYRTYLMLVKKIKLYNMNTNLMEILRSFNFLMNICITYDMLHLLPKWQSHINKRRPGLTSERQSKRSDLQSGRQ